MRQRRTNALVGHGLGLQDAVNANPDLQAGFLRLDVNVRGPDLNGILKQRLQQAHHRRTFKPDRGAQFTKVNRVSQVFLKRTGQAADLFGAPVKPVKRQ
ncbi:hypothetical protein GALL_542760 [mine drainage metagenome]|uniref:Uncharacterized protein n=1 Tax=mine drainage metagenome TaxID=410659 RepID=A0A1J5NZC3_9ZZZZ